MNPRSTPFSPRRTQARFLSQASGASGSPAAPQTRSDAGAGALVGWWIHCAANRAWKPNSVRSRSATLSLTEAPGAVTSIRAASAAESAPGGRFLLTKPKISESLRGTGPYPLLPCPCPYGSGWAEDALPPLIFDPL